MSSKQETTEQWTPRTELGKLVQEGKITSLDEVFERGMKIREPQIVDLLLPRITEEVVTIDLVQKQTDAGERNRYRVLVVVGDGDGHVGLGVGKARQVRNAIEKGVASAKLNITPVRRGCGSYECRCGQPHSLLFAVSGKSGSVRIFLYPAPRGLGLVTGDTPKIVLRLAGISDCWSRSDGSTSTKLSFAVATFDALRKTFSVLTPDLWTR
ncbi:MAG: 30S ribosomal protein S5 [Thermoproteota archaeon]